MSAIQLEVAAAVLGPILEEVVFVGGATVHLWLTEPGAPPVRATDRWVRPGCCRGPGVRAYTAHVATRDRTVRLTTDSYELLAEEARRRGVDPDALADELLRSDLAARSGEELDAVLANADALRARLPQIDGVALAREAREELDDRRA